MIKKLVRIATTFGLLVAGYVGYVQAFALVSTVLSRPPDVPLLPLDAAPSRGSMEAKQLSQTAFGPGDWTNQAKIRYYDSAKGYWIYTQDYVRKDEGKRIELTPFALIWRDRRGKPLKTVTSQRAILTFNHAPDMLKGAGQEARITHARIEGDVRIRDDKGTPANLGDDMTISLPYVEFDEAKQLVHSDSALTIRERDAVATGEDLEIPLIAAAAGSKSSSVVGYQGARSIKLKRNVHISVEDVGSSGIVPGGVQKPADATKPRTPRPGEVQCAGELLIELPPPREADADGPDEPTHVHFSRDVIVRQGDAQAPEQLNCDQLHLTLFPSKTGPRKVVASAKDVTPPPSTDSEPAATADGGPVSNLVLRHAHATGHAVWLQSTAREAVAFGNELVYRRGEEGQPDVTHFRGDRWTEIRKQNSTQGTIDVIRTTDITLYHTGSAEEPMSIVARGPGWLETRSLADESVKRSARWGDQCVMQPVAGDPTRRQLTLQGNPEIRDTERGFMNAQDRIVASLVARPKAPSEGETSESEPESESYSIELMQAWGKVLLVSNDTPSKDQAQPPSQSSIQAREWLGVVFEQKPDASPSAPSQPAAVAAAPADPKPADPNPTVAQAGQAVGPPKPKEPPLTVSADRIWAWVTPIAGAETKEKVAQKSDSPIEGEKWDLREVRLRGDVVVHQDASVGKKQGLDAEGREIDVLATGNKQFKLRAAGSPERMAFVKTSDLLIEGALLGLDQGGDYAWVDGPGKLVQKNTGGGLLGAASLQPTALVQTQSPPKPSAKLNGPLTIAWGRDPTGALLAAGDTNRSDAKPFMKFYGQSVDDRGMPGPALAHFSSGVRAWTYDSVLICNDMRAYLDAPVDFSTLAKSSGGFPGMGTVADSRDSAAAAPQPQIARIECRGGVDITQNTFSDDGLVQSKRRLRSEHAEYERASNAFHVKSAGVLDIYERGQGALANPRAREADARAKTARAKAATTSGGPEPLKLTRVWFEKQMDGQISTSETARGRQAGQAEFFGTPRIVNAPVPDEDTELDEDHLPNEGFHAVSDTMRFLSEPPLPGAPANAPDRQFVQAWGQLYARSKSRGREFAIRASDHMDMNSETGLSYIYGGESGVTIVDQTGLGQQASYARGSTIIYNHKTGEHKLLDARDISIVDPGSGLRAGVPPVPPERLRQKPKRKLYPRVDDGDKERSNFTGR